MSTSLISPSSSYGTESLTINLGRNTTRSAITKTFIVEGDNGEASENRLIVTQGFAALMNEADVSIGTNKIIAYDATGEARTVTFEGHANGKMMKYQAPSGLDMGSAISFTGFNCKECSGSVTGQVVGTSFGDVENFEGGLQEYDYFITIPVPVAQAAGNYGVTVVTADSASGVTESVTYYVTITEPGVDAIPIEIHAIYKSSDGAVETLSADLSWKEGASGSYTDESAEIETQSGDTNYSYDTFVVAQIDPSTTSLRLKTAADITGTKVVGSTASVYASSNSVSLPSYITGGSFISGGTSLSNISVSSSISGATEYTVDIASVRSSLSLDEDDPINLYILYTAAEPPAPVSPSITNEEAQVEVDRNQQSVLKGQIGYDLTVSNPSMSRTYKAKISLVCSGDPIDCGIEYTSVYPNGVLFDNTATGQTVIAGGAFSASASISSGRGINISDVLTAEGDDSKTDAEIMEYVWQLMSEQRMWFEIDLWYNDSHWTNHPIEIGADSNKLRKVGTD